MKAAIEHLRLSREAYEISEQAWRAEGETKKAKICAERAAELHTALCVLSFVEGFLTGFFFWKKRK